jgi:hypothetical protein
VKLRTVIPAACVGAIAFTATACGGSGGSGAPAATDDPVAAVRRAPDATRAAGSSKWETRTVMRSPAKTVELTGTGAYQYGKSMGTLSLTMPAEAGMKGPLKEVITPDALYVRGAAKAMPDKWVKLDLPKLAANNLVSSGSLDPSTSLQMLRGVNAGVTRVGSEELRGVRVQHYSGTLDLRKALESASPEARPTLDAAVKSLSSTTIPFEVYLDESGRLCKIEQVMQVPVKSDKKAQSVKIETATELFDFGAPVKVEVPPDSEVVQAAGPGTGAGR